MPEGPEVRRAGFLLDESLSPKRELALLTEVKLVSGKLAREGLNRTLALPSRYDVFVRGKSIFIALLDNGLTLHSTLGMSGWWYPDPTNLPPERAQSKLYRSQQTLGDYLGEVVRRYCRLTLVSTHGTAHYIDPRNFGNFKVLTSEERDAKLEELGDDLITDPITDDTLNRFRERNKATTAIGEALLNQSGVSGIGNIYRAESLWSAKISPFRAVGELTDGELRLILEKAKEIMTESYLQDGQLPFNVYGVGQKATLGGRTMWWDPKVQA